LSVMRLAPRLNHGDAGKDPKEFLATNVEQVCPGALATQSEQSIPYPGSLAGAGVAKTTATAMAATRT